MFQYALCSFLLSTFLVQAPSAAAQATTDTTTTTDCSNGNSNTNPTGPLLEESWADPCIIRLANGTHYTMATNHYKGGKTINVPVADSEDFTSGWHLIDALDALPFAGAWTTQPDAHVWAPDVNELVCSYCIQSQPGNPL